MNCRAWVTVISAVTCCVCLTSCNSAVTTGGIDFLGTATCIAESPDHSQLLIVGPNEAMIVRSNGHHKAWRSHENYGPVAVWSDDGAYFAVEHDFQGRSQIEFWSSRELKPASFINPFPLSTGACSLGQFLVIAGGVGTTEFGISGAPQIWSFPNDPGGATSRGILGKSATSGSRSVNSANLQNGEWRVAVAYEDGKTPEIWSCMVGESGLISTRLVSSFGRPVESDVAISRNGAAVAVLTSTVLEVYDVSADGVVLRCSTNINAGRNPRCFRRCEFAPNGDVIAIAGEDGVQVRQSSDLQIVATLGQGQGAIAFQDNGRTLIASQRDDVMFFAIKDR